MSAINFVAIVIVLAFATGFVVAAIIWGISWAISTKDEKTTISGFMKVFNSYYKPHLAESAISVNSNQSKLLQATEETKNKEIYKFYHGKN